MTDVITGVPVAAWYPDPARPELLRWWDGSSWSAHTMPRPDAVPPVMHAVPHTAPPKEIPDPMPFASGIALGTDGPGLYNTEPPILTPIERAARAEIYAKLASSHGTEAAASSNRPGSRSFGEPATSLNWATPEAPSLVLADYPLRSSTPGVWLLALSPLLIVGVFAFVVFQALKLPEPVVPMILAYASLWILPLVFALVDRAGLRTRDHTERPSVWWMLLGPLVYLIVRTVKLSRRARAAFVPLVVYVVMSLLASVSIVLLTPAAYESIHDLTIRSTLQQLETSLAVELQNQTGVSYQVQCPDTATVLATCHAVGSDGATIDFEVKFDADGNVSSIKPIQ